MRSAPVLSLLPPGSDEKHLPLLPEVVLFECGPESDKLRFLENNNVHLDKGRLPWLLAYTLLSSNLTGSSSLLRKKIQYLESCGARLDDTRLPQLLQQASTFQPGQSLTPPQHLDPATSYTTNTLSTLLETTFSRFGPEDERVRYLIYTKNATFPDLPALLCHILKQDRPLSWAIFLENHGARLGDTVLDLLQHFTLLQKEKEDAADAGGNKPVSSSSSFTSNQQRIDFLIEHLLFTLELECNYTGAWSMAGWCRWLSLHTKPSPHTSAFTRAIFNIVKECSYCKTRPILRQLPREGLLSILSETSQRHLIRPPICKALSTNIQTEPTPAIRLINNNQTITVLPHDIISVFAHSFPSPCPYPTPTTTKVIDLTPRGFPTPTLYRLFDTFIKTGMYDPSELSRDEQLNDVLAARYYGMNALLGVMSDVLGDDYPTSEVIDEFEAAYYVVESFG